MYTCSFDKTNNGCINCTKGYVIESWTTISYPCVVRHMYFVLFNFIVVLFLLEFLCSHWFCFFFLLLFRSGAISILFLSLMNLLSFFFTLSRSSSIFFFTNFYLKKREIIFLNVLLLWLLNLFATFIFFLCYDVRIILHFEIIITYNLKILYLSSRVLFFSKKIQLNNYITFWWYIIFIIILYV